MDKLRAVALYRVSTKQQMDKENLDIPAQKNIVQDFIKKKDWNLIKEFVEGGISGYKTKTDDRDALQTIKAMALNKQFDALVVYCSDRVGRIADETPLVISFLNNHDVCVWSVTEGEIKSKTHNDKLVTYLRYWQNEGESIKQSIRVSDYQIDMVQSGRYRGGNMIPFGYQLQDNGNRNFKKRPVLDFIINEEEAETVKLIYSLSTNKNFGQSRIAKYLNENKEKLGCYNRGNKGWSASTIQYILANPIYKGQLHMKSTLYEKEVTSPIQENLIIIPEKVWDENRRMVESRKYKKNKETVRDDRPRNTHGKMLLSGIAFCGHCGHALTTQTVYKRWTLKDGTKKKVAQYRYRCSSFYKKGDIKCDGQSTYSPNRIDPVVISETKNFILNLQEKQLDKEFSKQLEKKIDSLRKNLQTLTDTQNEAYEELKALKKEISKSLLGKSKFDSDLLNEAIHDKEEEISKNEKDSIEIQELLKNAQNDRDSYINLDSGLKDWSQTFDKVDFDTKKAMLATIIDKVKVYNDNIEIIFNVKLETYKENSICKDNQLVRVLA